MIKYILAVASLIIIIGILTGADNRQAMNECQKTHSFDTCYYTLHH